MKLKKAIKYSYRNISRSKLRNSMVVLAIILSVILGGIVIGVVNGIKNYYTNAVYEAGFNALFVVSGKASVGGSFVPPKKPLAVDDLRSIKVLPKVKAVSPLFIAGVFRFGENVTYLIGADEDLSISASFTLYKGRFLNGSDSNSSYIPVVLGYNVWNNILNRTINVGDNISLVFEPFSIIYGKKEPINISVHIIGLLQKRAQVPGLGIDPNSVFYTDLTHVYKIFNITNLKQAYADGAVVSAESFQDLDVVNEEITNLLVSKGYDKRTDFSIISQKDALVYINKVFLQINSFVSIIWAVVLTIGSLSVLIVMVITVRERYREIGTLRSFGAKRRDILLLFLFEAAWLSIIGLIIGSILGVIIIELLKNYYEFIKFITFNTIIETYAIVLPEIFLASLLFALYPAYRATRIDPAQALRYE
jgi:putative ABC transport system permease protein